MGLDSNLRVGLHLFILYRIRNDVMNVSFVEYTMVFVALGCLSWNWGRFKSLIHLAFGRKGEFMNIGNQTQGGRLNLASNSKWEMFLIFAPCAYLLWVFTHLAIGSLLLIFSFHQLALPYLTTRVPLTHRRRWLSPFVSKALYRSLAFQRFVMFEASKEGQLMPDDSNEHKRVRRLLDDLKIRRERNESLGTEDMVFDYDWHIAVIRSDEENAFTWGWGTIVVCSALLGREDYIVQGVLSHEIGHMVCRHADELVPVLTFARNFLLPAIREKAYRDLASGALKLLKLSFGREQEEEADAFAVELMKHKWGDSRRSRSLVRLFAGWKNSTSCPEYRSWEAHMHSLLSTHPTLTSRQRACACRLAGYTHRATVEGLLYRASYFGWLGRDRAYLGEWHTALAKIFLWFIWWPLDAWWWRRSLQTVTVTVRHPFDRLKLPDGEAHIRRLELRALAPQYLMQYRSALVGNRSNVESRDLDETVREIVALELKRKRRRHCCSCGTKHERDRFAREGEREELDVHHNYKCLCCLTVFFGCWGVDRCYRGQRCLGILKLFSMSIGLGVFWWIYDIVLLCKER
eukprot:jgi/Bigna1/139079/aug1.48_g13787